MKNLIIKNIHPLTEVIVLSFNFMLIGGLLSNWNEWAIPFWISFSISMFVGVRYDYYKWKSMASKKRSV